MRDKQKPGRDTALEEAEEEEEERIRQHKRSGQHFRGKHNDRGDRSSNLYKEDFSHLGQDSQQKIKETDKGLDRISDLLDDMKLIALGTVSFFVLLRSSSRAVRTMADHIFFLKCSFWRGRHGR
jgi:hypothetical protein